MSPEDEEALYIACLGTLRAVNEQSKGWRSQPFSAWPPKLRRMTRKCLMLAYEVMRTNTSISDLCEVNSRAPFRSVRAPEVRGKVLLRALYRNPALPLLFLEGREALMSVILDLSNFPFWGEGASSRPPLWACRGAPEYIRLELIKRGKAWAEKAQMTNVYRR